MLLAAVALGALVAACRVPHPRGRWNVVVVLVDTLRADHLGAYGYDRPTSPRLDELARGAYLFTDAHAQAPCTFPSVNSLLTSRYPARFLDQPDRAIGIPANVRSIAEILRARGWSTAAVSASIVVRATPGAYNPLGGFGRGFQRFDEDCTEREAGCVTNHGLVALDRLREPFFLYLHYIDPHAPYAPPQPFRRRFRLGRSSEPWALHGNPKPVAAMINDGGRTVPVAPADVRFVQGLYDGEIASFDAQLGRLLDELRRRGTLDRTILAVVADHGESFLEHGNIGHCRTLYESEIHTPFVLRLPGQRDGHRLAANVENVDLVPTLVDLLGLPLAEQRFEGVSLVPLLDGAAPRARDSYALIGSERSVDDGRYKLILDLRRAHAELYDLQSDPQERHDLASTAREPLLRLRGKLLSWVKRMEGTSGAAKGEEALRRLRGLGYL